MDAEKKPLRRREEKAAEWQGKIPERGKVSGVEGGKRCGQSAEERERQGEWKSSSGEGRR